MLLESTGLVVQLTAGQATLATRLSGEPGLSSALLRIGGATPLLLAQVHPQLSDAVPLHRGLPGKLHPGGHRQIRADHQLVKHEDASLFLICNISQP